VALSLRSYLFEEDGTIKRIFGNDAMPQYANTIQRVVAVIVENEDGKPLRIVSAQGSFKSDAWLLDQPRIGPLCVRALREMPGGRLR
jgi:hypothetical protein